MTGRPALYTAAIAERILDELTRGRSLRAVCQDALYQDALYQDALRQAQGMPNRRTVMQWVSDDREGFAARYRRARDIGGAATARPSLYTTAIADRILDGLSKGRTLAELCRDPAMPSVATVEQWRNQDREGFAARYRRSKAIGGAATGRPTTYTTVIAERILDELSEGRTLADICRDPGMPAQGTVWQWKHANREGFAARYKTAREWARHVLEDQILEIADDGRNDWIVRRRMDGTTFIFPNCANIRQARLRIASRLWLLSKTLPRHYGKRPDPDAWRPPVDTPRRVDEGERGTQAWARGKRVGCLTCRPLTIGATDCTSGCPGSYCTVG